jgi:hypothetical protein
MSADHIGRLLRVVGFFALGWASCAVAQAPAPSVQWNASAARDPADAQGRRLTVEISAVIPDGWHVYAVNQLPGGPTPLLVTIGDGSAGTPTGSAPVKRHDPSFDLDTEFYTHAITLVYPVQATGSQAPASSLPVSVRFQLCSEHECQPPKTVHLSAAITAAGQT